MPNQKLLFPPLVATGSTGPFLRPPWGTRHVPAYDEHPLTAPPGVCCGLPGRRGGPFRILGGSSGEIAEGALRAPEGWTHRQPPQVPSCTLRGKVPGVPSGPGTDSPTGEKGGSRTLCAETDDEDPGTSLLGVGGVLMLFHIPNFSSLAASLTDLTRKGQPEKVQWSSASEEAFQRIKEALTSEPVLRAPDLAAPSCCRRMPPTRDWEPSCHRFKKGRSIPSCISAGS